MLAWGLWAGNHPDPRAIAFSPLLERLDDYEESVLGGYRDATEARLLIVFLIAWAVLAARCFPVSRKRWRALSHHERLLWVFVGVNLLIFAVGPSYTSLVGETHMRHAVIATSLLPALAAREFSPRRARRAVAGAGAAGGRHDRETPGSTLSLRPRGARLRSGRSSGFPSARGSLPLIWDSNGAVMRTQPYWHFGAYAQARRGGLLAYTFPRVFRNLPLRMRDDVQIPRTPPQLFERAYLFDYRAFGYAYDHVLVRTGETKGRDRFPEFPYQLVFEAAPWQLWRALPKTEAPPPESREEGRLGQVSLFRPAQPQRSLVFLFSDEGGFGPDLAQAARALAAQGWRWSASISRPTCRASRRATTAATTWSRRSRSSRSGSSASSASRATARRSSPGVGEGGTLAYAALAQSPAATVGGAVGVDRAPVLETRVPLCPGAPSHAEAGGFAYAPIARAAGSAARARPTRPARRRAPGSPPPRCERSRRSPLRRAAASLAGLPLDRGPRGAARRRCSR